jgi:hypothetical protein
MKFKYTRLDFKIEQNPLRNQRIKENLKTLTLEMNREHGKG